MAQQVEYPSIPNTQPKDYQSVVKSLLGYVKREAPTDKALRRHMRSRSIFDKATAPQLFDLLGIEADTTGPCQLTELGQKFFDIDEDVEWKKFLFKELARRNEILVKYVFDALTERLYSINEMYRVLTSYVYPGETVTLVNFKNWMGWIEATGMIKYIGIRWGPSPLVKEIQGYLDGIDIEEILEEEGEEYEYEDDYDFDESSEEAEASAEEAPSAPSRQGEGGEEDVPDMPPEPPSPPMAGPTPLPPPSAAPVGAPAHAAAAHAAPQTIAPMPTYRSTLTLRSIAEIREIQKVLDLDPGGAELALRVSALDDAEIAKNLEGLRGLWQTRKDVKPLSFDDFGIDPADYKPRSRKKGVKTFFLYRALVAATCAFRPVRVSGLTVGGTPDGISRFKLLESSGALSRHFVEGHSIDDVITALIAAGHGHRQDILALTPYLVLAKQALADADDWVKKQESGEKDAVVEAVYEQLHAGVFTIELIWLLRELARTELWNVEGLKQIGVVPTQEVLDIAFRIGLLPTPYVGDFNSALYASVVLTGFCGADYGYEAGLQYFGDQLRCAYDCPNRTVCSYFCRERLRR